MTMLDAKSTRTVSLSPTENASRARTREDRSGPHYSLPLGLSSYGFESLGAVCSHDTHQRVLMLVSDRSGALNALGSPGKSRLFRRL